MINIQDIPMNWNLLRNASLLEVARTAKSCSKRQNVAQKLPSTTGKGLMFASFPSPPHAPFPKTSIKDLQRGLKACKSFNLRWKAQNVVKYRHRPWVLKFRTGDVRIPPFPLLLNHLSPKINIQILHTGLHTFLEKLLERICQRSKHFLRWSFH